jgi:hypothetical protein
LQKSPRKYYGEASLTADASYDTVDLPTLKELLTAALITKVVSAPGSRLHNGL